MKTCKLPKASIIFDKTSYLCILPFFSGESWVHKHLSSGAQPKIKGHWATGPLLVFFPVGMSGYNFQKILYFLFVKIFFTFTNSVDPNEMQYYAAFHLDLHSLYKYLFRGSPNTKG